MTNFKYVQKFTDEETVCITSQAFYEQDYEGFNRSWISISIEPTREETENILMFDDDATSDTPVLFDSTEDKYSYFNLIHRVLKTIYKPPPKG